MPSDIRSFFGGKLAPKPTPSKDEQQSSSKAKPKPKKRNSKVVEDSDDDVVETQAPKKPTPKKAPAKKEKIPSPPPVETTASDYFGSNKPKRSDAITTAAKRSEPTPKSTPKKANGKTNGTALKTPNDTQENGVRTSSRKKTYTKVNLNDDLDAFDLDDDEGVHAAEYKKNGRTDDYEEGDSDDEVILPKRKERGNGVQSKLNKQDDDFTPDEDVDMHDVDPEDDMLQPDPEESIAVNKPAKKTASRKRKSEVVEIDDDGDEAPPAKKGKAAPKPKSKATPKKSKKQDVTDSAEIQAIMASIPTVVAPKPPPKDASGKAKFQFGGQHANSGPPPAAGSKELPSGAENCLAGLTFVFTGLLDTLSRDEGQSLVKQYGGKCMTAPSKNTKFVVLGADAGPKKLETIEKLNITTINEEGLFELIRKLPANGGDSAAAATFSAKKEKAMEKIKEMAEEMEKQDRRKGGARGAGASKGAVAGAKPTSSSKPAEDAVDSRLWTVKYAPTQINQICGNKIQVERLQTWLRAFQNNLKSNFKKPGKDGSGTYRAVMIHGPPGIGKTTAAHLVANLEGYDVVESNASDTRSKKLVESGLKGVLDTNSMHGYFAAAGEKVTASKKKLVLIMDEVDGMSAGDRGGVGALAKVCKQTSVPMILICNDRKLPKMKPFDFVTFDLAFRRPTTDQIRSRIMTINYREGIKMPTPVINALIEGTHADIRQVVNMISTAKLDQEAMDFDKSKDMSKAWQKHVMLKPWDITSKILGGGLFAAASKATLNDKTELYFNDHDFSYLMLQENYLGTSPAAASNYQGRERGLKLLELVDKAAESISDGDLVDRMIHGSEQQWSLMPTHAVFSFVRPASFIAGSMAGHSTRFTAWLGKNSAQGRMMRLVKEIQGHMRMRSSGDAKEIRQQYVPVLWQKLLKKLQVDGKDAVGDIIDLMDSYFLTKDDFDAISELGVGYMDMEKLKIDSNAKSAFTRTYNQLSHPLPFIKASNVIEPKKQAKEKPDLEEAVEESDEGEVVDEAPEAEDDDAAPDFSKDKYVSVPKKKKAPAAKRKKGAAGDGEDSDEDAKPKAKRGKGKDAAGKAKAKGKK
ncbi:DNA replication factor C, large subunit [Aulographum hederae CBS 113979]|uniref:Replication factor C subunit 1 n=1 Tax=Aulographum hederae CBS 113979 TaxID=1176131 RepID=A0A6G1HEJ2_9PEZI|nr:DNA replication factor C, large subunit [Aulographum hederae CBS 113979]